MQDLVDLHQKHLNKGPLDDSTDMEHRIEIVTADCTALFHQAQKVIKSVARKASAGTQQEQKLSTNAMRALAIGRYLILFYAFNLFPLFAGAASHYSVC